LQKRVDERTEVTMRNASLENVIIYIPDWSVPSDSQPELPAGTPEFTIKVFAATVMDLATDAKRFCYARIDRVALISTVIFPDRPDEQP
jgi:hypothetical protein